MESPMWSIFDGVYVLGFTGFRSRMETMREELLRVGLDGKAEIVWNFHNPYDGVLYRNIKMDTRPKYMSACLGHYRIIKTAYELGKESILILEDDARFLTDLKQLDECLDYLPAEADIALLDHHLVDPATKNVILSNPWWNECLDKRVSSAAYALNRTGMKWMIEQYEIPLTPNGHGMMCCDQMFDRKMMPPGFGFYVAAQNAAIQIHNDICTTPGNDLKKRYEILKVKTENYG